MQVKGRSGAVKAEETRGSSRSKRKANEDDVEEPVPEIEDDVEMDNDGTVPDSVGLAKRIEDAVVIEEDPISEPMEIEPQVFCLIFFPLFVWLKFIWCLIFALSLLLTNSIDQAMR
jgi:hypothetical protein